MKKKLFHFIVILLTVSTVLSLAAPAMATDSVDNISPRASAYITGVWAGAYGGDGSIRIEFDITATGKMTSLGATSIEIINSSGRTVKTFVKSTTPSMMGSNQTYYSSSVTYYGATSGERYYAIVYYKASNSSGSDTTSYTTNYATA